MLLFAMQMHTTDQNIAVLHCPTCFEVLWHLQGPLHAILSVVLCGAMHRLATIVLASESLRKKTTKKKGMWCDIMQTGVCCQLHMPEYFVPPPPPTSYLHVCILHYM